MRPSQPWCGPSRCRRKLFSWQIEQRNINLKDPAEIYFVHFVFRTLLGKHTCKGIKPASAAMALASAAMTSAMNHRLFWNKTYDVGSIDVGCRLSSWHKYGIVELACSLLVGMGGRKKGGVWSVVVCRVVGISLSKLWETESSSTSHNSKSTNSV